MQPDLNLFPQPKSVEFTGGSYTVPEDGFRAPVQAMESDEGPQSFHISVRPDGVTVRGQDQAGSGYAIQSLIQLVNQFAGREIPCMEIHDAPDFLQRGVMLDVSRDKVPTWETLRDLVDKLAGLRINQLQLYTEHTFAYAEHERVWRDASPFTAYEIRALDTYCRKRHIELVPNQNSFGHLKPWLIHPEYRHLAEAPDGCNTIWGPQDGPFSLCPGEPGSLELLRGLYDELLPNFESRFFNVGCDETVDLGEGRSQQVCDDRGKGRVYLDFLLEIHELVAERDHKMMFWGDIINKHPELIPELPRDVVVMEWGYEADHPFEENLERFAASGLPFYVCPGTSSWCSLTGRTDNMLANIRSAVTNGKKFGASGVLITDWGDHGHWQPLPVSYPALIYGAAMAWNAEGPETFPEGQPDLLRQTMEMGNLYKLMNNQPHNSSAVFNLLRYPDRELGKGQLAEIDAEGLNRVLEGVQDGTNGLREVDPDAPEKEELQLALDMTAHACRFGLARLGKGDAKKLGPELWEITERFQAVWLKRNRRGGLKDSVARMERLFPFYEQL